MKLFAPALLLFAVAVPMPCLAQDASGVPAPVPSAAPRQPGELSETQQADFEAARKSFGMGQYAAALSLLRPLHEKHPRNALVAKFAAEAAIDTGDLAYAEGLLKPLVVADASDWQAHILLTRCYAQQGKDADRDAELATLTKMYAETNDPQFKQRTQFLVEQTPTSHGGLQIFWSLQPYSGYHVYELGRVLDATGRRLLQITLESDDFDQPAWAKAHPQLAAAGQRAYSLDGYRDDVDTSGKKTQTHFTFAFFEDGRPDYTTVRTKMLAIAEGKGQPMSSRSGLPVPQ